MTKKNVIHNARFGHFPVICECGNTITISLVKGYNRRATVCVRCKAIVRVECTYDGFGMATLMKMTSEILEFEDGKQVIRP